MPDIVTREYTLAAGRVSPPISGTRWEWAVVAYASHTAFSVAIDDGSQWFTLPVGLLWRPPRGVRSFRVRNDSTTTALTIRCRAGDGVMVDNRFSELMANADEEVGGLPVAPVTGCHPHVNPKEGNVWRIGPEEIEDANEAQHTLASRPYFASNAETVFTFPSAASRIFLASVTILPWDGAGGGYISVFHRTAADTYSALRCRFAFVSNGAQLSYHLPVPIELDEWWLGTHDTDPKAIVLKNDSSESATAIITGFYTT